MSEAENPGKKVSLEIIHEGLNSFSDSALAKFKTELEEYAIAVIKESNLIAEADCEKNTKIEVTSTIVVNGFKKKKNKYQSNRTKVVCNIAKAVSPISFFFAGIFANKGFSNTLEIIGFTLLIVLATVSTVLAYMLDNGGN